MQEHQSRSRASRRRPRVSLMGAALLVTGLGLASAVGSPAAGATGDTAWTAGLNSDGQLGNGNVANRAKFGAVNGLSNVDAVAGGREHALALTGGRVYSWGDGSKGALGQGTPLSDRSTPTVVPNLTGVAAITTGHYSSYALLTDGTVRAWGYNASGQLGNNSTAMQSSPVTVSGLSGVKQIAAGRDMAMALMNDGTVRTWGRGTEGELGNGANPTTQRTPVTVPTLTGVAQLAGGRDHVLALMNDGSIRAWGQNTYGQVGNGTTANQNRPVTVPGITTAVDVEAGAEFSVAVLADGSVRTWGRSNSGQLGQGNTQTHTSPVAVTGLPAIAQVGCGRAHVLAITTTGDLWGWGLDNYGQLGDRAGGTRSRPVHIAGVTGVEEAHGGYGYSVILRPAA